MSISKPRAEELLSAFTGKKVLVVGNAFVDTYIQGEIERLNPESHHVHLLRVGGNGSALYRSGGAGNAARNIRSLGGVAKLLSVRGSDSLGLKAISVAKSEGYEAHFVSDHSRGTIEKRRYFTKDGVLLRVDYEDPASTRPINEEVTGKLLDTLKQLLPGVDAVFVSDYGKGMLTGPFCDRMIDLVKTRGIPIMADVKPAQIGHFIGVDMIAPNLKEAFESLGKDQHAKPEEVAELLVKRISTEVFLTAGSLGICIAKKGEQTCMVKQAHLVKVGDTSGCGDTAAAAILLAKLAGATSEEAAELANAAAAVTVSMVGAYAPTSAEVTRMLAS